MLRIHFISKADVVKLTDEESEWLFGIPAAEAVKFPSLVQEHFPKAFGVLITAGEKGAAYWFLGHTGIVPRFEVKVAETTGGKIKGKGAGSCV